MFVTEVYMHNGDGIRDGPGDWPVHWGWYPEQAVSNEVAPPSSDRRIVESLFIIIYCRWCGSSVSRTASGTS